ncbi:MAG: DUF6538 domain-containing protein [Candidatus Accumulibacter sp. UW26]|jgi:integrase
MPKPYLQRRGDTYSFRIAVPSDLRTVLGSRELVRTLKTADRRTAAPYALLLASKALILFSKLRAMPDDQRDAYRLNYTVKLNLDEAGFLASLEVEGEPHEQEAINSTVRTALQAAQRVAPGTQLAAPPSPPEAPAPMLSTIIESYFANYPSAKEPMRKKHAIVLPLFLEIVGDKAVSDLKQADVRRFFSLLNKLPPRARQQCQKMKISIAELAELPHGQTLSPSAFDDTYKACVRQFLSDSKRDWQDQGFPTNLTTDGCDYTGTRKDGESKQRALTREELKLLFEGPAFQNFSTNPDDVHKFWLPVLGLYTGARANELCQINPQTDVFIDTKSGIWCLLLSEDTESGQDIAKSIKTGESRAIPLHRHLIGLGFPAYVEAIKSSGAKQLFPAWKPRGGRAAPSAIDWFSKFLGEIGLHGVENERGRALHGMHAFRHTLLTYGKLGGVNLRCISGHAERSDNVVADGYEDDTLLTTLIDKRDLLDQLDYGLRLPVPVLPSAYTPSDKLTPKYRDPASGETWAGRGSMPKWLKVYQEQGRDLEEFLISRIGSRTA